MVVLLLYSIKFAHDAPSICRHYGPIAEGVAGFQRVVLGKDFPNGMQIEQKGLAVCTGQGSNWGRGE